MENTTGMSSVISSLTTTLSASNLWGIIGDVVPFIGVSVLFGLGFFLVKKVINKIKKAKGGV